MSKEKRIILVSILVGIIVIGLLSSSIALVERVPNAGEPGRIVVDYNPISSIIAVVLQSIAFLFTGSFIVTTIVELIDKEKGWKQKLKEFFIRLIITVIVVAVLIIAAKLVWEYGKMFINPNRGIFYRNGIMEGGI